MASLRKLLLLPLLLLSCVVHAELPAPQDDVQEATEILRSIVPSPRSQVTTKQTGITYYAKELFSQLFLLRPPTTSASPDDARTQNEPLNHALQLLERAAKQDNADALLLLAELNFHGNYTHPRNFSAAFTYYERLASLTGNASAQHMLGFMYATGIGGAVEPDQAKALLYYTFAAEGGDIRAEMAVAYRHHAGISTPRNCDEAVHYYKSVADKAIAYLRTGPPGNHMVIKDSYRLADDHGGVYGEGASVSSAGVNAKYGPAHSDAHASFEDVLEYMDFMSRKGDLKATFTIGKLHYDGSRGMKRDLRLARHYFLEVARAVWPKKGPRKQDVSASTEKLAAKAAGFLGRMFLRGEGVKQDFALAQVWFTRGLSAGDALSQYSMGIMYLYGYGVPQDTYRAAEYFLPAADQDLASAQVRLGVLFLDQGDTLTALQYFDHAQRNGHVEAYYYLAELSYAGIGRDQSCPVAAAYYKIAAEKVEMILAPFREANEAYAAGDLETALVDYLLAAEQGFEAAQQNVAWILDRALPRRFALGSAPSSSSSASALSTHFGAVKPSPFLALLHWSRSAAQRNIDSLLKTGDYYLYGLGTNPSPEHAASCYQAAAETMMSAQAYWNLGWMHENGVGMGQDFHLAKRFYDLALETNKEAYLPVKLALGKLRIRSGWNRWFGGDGGIRSIEDEKLPKKTWSEWLHAFLEADAALARDYDYEATDPTGLLDDRDDWYGSGGHAGGDPGGDYDDLDFEDGLLESLLIVGAAALLMMLIVYRRRRQEERERAQLGLPPRDGQQLDGDGARGLFPAPGEPEFAGWVAGGVGH
ncbi:uncharacterized protein PV09_06425 [Verruconis gallopava]|uniref:DOD-type homing endonuclease domain-containing protein n=1 Tax=Verruconis gallopava TaxID=253628 RepID=A0A0D2A6R6_9PEZI|nr:uncharacterized protein PV09_06425 [Verruconis gallopava]KIW02275.1 hypothetical protein PV09_06425 [Verruconis gallopava]